MSAPKREQFANNAADTLNGGINNSVTSLDLNDASEFPSAGNFRILIGSEILICTARSTNTLTVLRGQEGTTAASHSDTDVVTQIVTADSIDRLVKDSVPAAGGFPVFKLVADDGATLLVASDFTWRNQEDAVATDQAGSILLTTLIHTDVGSDQRILERTAPSAPYVYIGAFRGLTIDGGIAGGGPSFGMGLLENSTGKNTAVSVISTSAGSKIRVQTFASPTTSNPTAHVAVIFYSFIGPQVWFKVEDDNTNVKFYIGDGLNWIELWSAGRTSQMAGGPDRVFWFINNSGGDFDIFARLVHWSRVS